MVIFSRARRARAERPININFLQNALQLRLAGVELAISWYERCYSEGSRSLPNKVSGAGYIIEEMW